jgi:hypothetical protein
MSKKLILVFLCVVFFSGPHFARADVVINEFVSHPNSGEKEWVELFNTNSADEVDLSDWKLTDLTSPSTDPKEEKLLDLSGVLSSSNNDILVFEFTSKLNDAGDSIGLYNGTTLIDRVSYGNVVSPYVANITAPSVGTSGALISGIWQTDQSPTKGTQNPDTAVVSISSDDSDTSDESSSDPTVVTTDNSSSGGVTTTKSKTVVEQKIKTQITSKALSLVNVPLAFQATTLGHSGEKLYSGEYFWNFGDGGSGKMDAFNTQPFFHTYYYPGNYVVSLDYYQAFYTDDSAPDASSQINIKIIPENISISNVGDANDFFIEITNNTNDNANLSSWVLVSDQKGFKIPKNTIVASKQKIILSPKITNFSIEDENTLKLLDSQGNLIFDYSSPPINQLTSSETAPIKTKNQSKNFTPEEIPANNLTASAISGNITNNDDTSNLGIIIFVIFLIFIGVAAYAVYFIRHKKMIPQNENDGNDFEILDE